VTEPEAGWIAPSLAQEWPELRLWSLRVDDARPGPTTPGLRQRLRAMSDRYTGAKAIQLRTDPIPHAYRAFYRHIGLDPDEDRVPIEAVVLERLKHGGFQAHDRVTDAATIALVETGVPIWVLDEARVDPPLGIDQRGDDLVVADGGGDVCALFALPGTDRAPGEETVAMRLFTVQVAGVPAIHVEEALFTAHEALTE
jgi:DNA/RNA-binding domain of Phe-tRNA-synthetase-like protein